jgi:hypothetical protein
MLPTIDRELPSSKWALPYLLMLPSNVSLQVFFSFSPVLDHLVDLVHELDSLELILPQLFQSFSLLIKLLNLFPNSTQVKQARLVLQRRSCWLIQSVVHYLLALNGALNPILVVFREEVTLDVTRANCELRIVGSVCLTFTALSTRRVTTLVAHSDYFVQRLVNVTVWVTIQSFQVYNCPTQIQSWLFACHSSAFQIRTLVLGLFFNSPRLVPNALV